MKTSKYTEAQIIAILRQADGGVATAKPVPRLTILGTRGHTRPRADAPRARRPQNEPSRSCSKSSQ